MPPTGNIPQAVQAPQVQQPAEQLAPSVPQEVVTSPVITLTPVAQQQVAQKPPVAPQVQQPPKQPLPTVAECIAQLKHVAQDWIARFSGKMNHNPHLRIAQLITPHVNALSTKDAV